MLASLREAKISNSNVLLRVDYNVPIINNVISNTTRIDETFATIEFLLQHNNTIILVSHLGRPDGKYNKNLSLQHVAKYLKSRFSNCEFITKPISLLLKEELKGKPLGSLLLLENIRFYQEEEKNDENFAKTLSSFANYYVNDAFACIHRTHASISKIKQFLPAYSGLLMEKETEKLTKHLIKPPTPYAAIIGGSKVSTKLSLLENLAKKTNFLLIGGAMANSFLKYKGSSTGSSLIEKDRLNDIKNLYQIAEENHCKIILPIDFTCALNINAQESYTKEIGDELKSLAIFDIGPKTTLLFEEILEQCSTIVWNGPVGAFEYELFKDGTLNLAKTLSRLCNQKNITVIAGGGDTIAALDISNTKQELSYISTGGGAFLYWLQSS